MILAIRALLFFFIITKLVSLCINGTALPLNARIKGKFETFHFS